MSDSIRRESPTVRQSNPGDSPARPGMGGFRRESEDAAPSIYTCTYKVYVHTKTPAVTGRGACATRDNQYPGAWLPSLRCARLLFRSSPPARREARGQKEGERREPLRELPAVHLNSELLSIEL